MITFKLNGGLVAELESIDGDPKEGEFTLVDYKTKDCIDDQEVYDYVMDNYFDQLVEEYYFQFEGYGDQSIMDVMGD